MAAVALPEPHLSLSSSDSDLRLVVTALMELLQAHRDELDRYGNHLRDRYERFACALRDSGFELDETHDRKRRAVRQRRVGELAEKGGHLDAALFFYELALRSWPEIGCRRRLEWLRRHHIQG